MRIHDKTIDTFTQAYLEAAFWTDANSDSDPDSKLEDKTVFDIAPSALTLLITQCVEFQQLNADDLKNIDDSQAGHDFWLTRNRHGAGFWDRGLGDVGTRLTESAHRYGEVSLICGDDGFLYFE